MENLGVVQFRARLDRAEWQDGLKTAGTLARHVKRNEQLGDDTEPAASMVADEGKRTLLFDLDQSIQELTPLVPADDGRLLRLTGVYHNLLRRWAST